MCDGNYHNVILIDGIENAIREDPGQNTTDLAIGKHSQAIGSIFDCE